MTEEEEVEKEERMDGRGAGGATAASLPPCHPGPQLLQREEGLVNYILCHHSWTLTQGHPSLPGLTNLREHLLTSWGQTCHQAYDPLASALAEHVPAQTLVGRIL